MKLSLLKMKNCLAIEEKEIKLGQVTLISGASETGKTSIIDSIRKGLGNEDVRDIFTTLGQDKSEIILKLDDDVEITRKIKNSKSTKLEIKKGGMIAPSPQNYINELLGKNNFDPIAFFKKSDKEKSKELLQLLDIKLTEEDIKKVLSKVPPFINYENHGLVVCENIEKALSENRTETGREKKSVKGAIDEMQLDIPTNYNPEKFRDVSLSDKFNEISVIEEVNNQIDKATNRIENVDSNITEYNQNLKNELEKFIQLEEEEIARIKEKYADKVITAKAHYKEKIDAETKMKANAEKYLKENEKVDTAKLKEEAAELENGKNMLSMFDRLQEKIKDLKELEAEYNGYTEDIKIIRELPAELLKKAESPIDGLSVKGGKVLINDLPLNNLSDGAKFRLAIKISQATSGSLKLILLNGFEQLNSALQKEVIKEIKKTDYQYVITQVTDGDLKIEEMFEDCIVDLETGEVK